jgi:hypothetical protein
MIWLSVSTSKSGIKLPPRKKFDELKPNRAILPSLIKPQSTASGFQANLGIPIRFPP